MRFCDALNTQYHVTKTWLKDWRNAVKGEKRKHWTQRRATQSPVSDELPTISITDRHMRHVTADALKAIQQANFETPFLFVRGGLPTRVEIDENGNVLAKTLNASAMRGIFERTANFVVEQTVEGESIPSPVNPPLDNVLDLMSLGGFPDLPPLLGVSTAPVVAPDGTICLEKGYQPASRYYHGGEEVEIGDTTPTDENLNWAKHLILDEMLGDFPFVNRAAIANTVALMLNPFVRPLVDGPTPLFAIDAATPGTGKTLLADVATLPFAPNGASIMTAGRDEEEWRKRITAKLIGAPSHLLLDNVKKKLTSGALAAALTVKHEWEDRLLGASTMVRLPVRCTWIATGNNLEFSDEIARRTVWIRLDAKVERPWKRTGFKHPNLREWVREHRAEIVTALLTFVRKWLEDGKPKSDVTLGSYEEWSHVVGGILKAVGIEGFMKNADELYDQLDSDRQAWVDFFCAWAERFGAYDPETDSWGVWIEAENERRWVSNPKPCRSVGTKELFPLASTYDDEEANGEVLGLLDEHLGRGKERARKNVLGKLLANTYKDRVFGGYRLEVLKKKVQRAAQFRLVNLQPIGESEGESSRESTEFDSPTPKSSDGADSIRVEPSESESSESKSTPSPAEENTPHTTQVHSQHDESTCVFESPETEADFDSLDSLSPSAKGQEPSGDKGSGMSESKSVSFTVDSPEQPPRTDDTEESPPSNGSELTRDEKIAHITDAEDWLDLPRSAIDSTWSDARIDALYLELLSKALARWKLIHNQQEPASTASSV